MNEKVETHTKGDLPKPFENLAGGRNMEVDFTNGTRGSVMVRQLKVRELEQYLKIIDDEPKVIELVCDKPAGWSDQLTLESFEALIAASESVNARPFDRWFERRLQRQEKLAPGFMKRALDSALTSGSRPSASKQD